MVRVLAGDKWLRVPLPAVPLSGSNLGQVVHTHVPLSPTPSSIIWYLSTGGDALRLGRSGVALATRHRLQWFIHLLYDGLDGDMSTPHTLSCGVATFYFCWFHAVD